MNSIRHIKVVPYHPSSNELAERTVQVFTQGFYKSVRGTVSDCISRFLFQYQLTLHSTTGVSPAELLMGRRVCSKLDLLMPNTQSKVLEKQDKQKQDHDQHCCSRCLTEGEKVWALNFRPGEKWLRGTVVRLKGPVSYKVKLENGQLCRCHIDQLRQHVDEQTSAHTAPPSYPPFWTVLTSLQQESSRQLHREATENQKFSNNDADAEPPPLVEPKVQTSNTPELNQYPV